MRIEEAAHPVHGLDFVAGELMLQYVDLMVEGHVEPDHEVLGLDVLLDAVSPAVEPAFPPPGQVQNGFPQGFRGDGAGMDRDTADPATPFDDQDGTPELCCLMAARRPAGPLPMTMKSYRVIIERITREFRQPSFFPPDGEWQSAGIDGTFRAWIQHF